MLILQVGSRTTACRTSEMVPITRLLDRLYLYIMDTVRLGREPPGSLSSCASLEGDCACLHTNWSFPSPLSIRSSNGSGRLSQTPRATTQVGLDDSLLIRDAATAFLGNCETNGIKPPAPFTSDKDAAFLCAQFSRSSCGY